MNTSSYSTTKKFNYIKQNAKRLINGFGRGGRFNLGFLRAIPNGNTPARDTYDNPRSVRTIHLLASVTKYISLLISNNLYYGVLDESPIYIVMLAQDWKFWNISGISITLLYHNVPH